MRERTHLLRYVFEVVEERVPVAFRLLGERRTEVRELVCALVPFDACVAFHVLEVDLVWKSARRRVKIIS